MENGMDNEVLQDKLIFYEKPGCVGNRDQKRLLRDKGIELTVRDLLNTTWTAGQLRPFFADSPIPLWFNSTAPAVKSGQIAIHQLSESEALELMISDPILIARPLLAYQDKKQSRFVQGPVLDALGVYLAADEDLNSCPVNNSPLDNTALNSGAGNPSSDKATADESTSAQKQKIGTCP